MIKFRAIDYVGMADKLEKLLTGLSTPNSTRLVIARDKKSTSSVSWAKIL